MFDQEKVVGWDSIRSRGEVYDDTQEKVGKYTIHIFFFIFFSVYYFLQVFEFLSIWV